MPATALPPRLTDDELVERAEEAAARAREATADLVGHLGEMEARGLHLKLGYESLFQYCRQALGMAEYSAYNRLEAARAVRRFPSILGMLRAGHVHPATVRLLAPHLTPANHESALRDARGRTKSQVEEIAARLAPRPDVPDFIRRLPARGPAPAPPSAPTALAAAASTAPPLAPGAAAPPPEPPPAPVWRATPSPGSSLLALSPGRHRLQATVDSETVEMLEMAQDLMRHANPTGEIGLIVARALRWLVRELVRQKFALTESPRGARGTGRDSRTIPVDVKRGVYLRDHGRCAYVAPGGRRCAARGFLQFHHVKPYMAGGEATLENIQLRCGAHNRYEGKVFFQREGGDRAP